MENRKKFCLFCMFAFCLLFAVSSSAFGTTKSWTTTSFTSMEHGTDYKWKVANYTSSQDTRWYIPEGEEITCAYLDIYNLNNWAIEYDYMNIYLLDKTGLYSWWSTTTFLTQYSDDNHYFDQANNRWVNPPENFHYDFNGLQIAALTSYLNDGIFGIGFDPNCHYYDTGIKFTIETSSTNVPEPATMLFLGLGLAGVAGLRRKFR